VPGWQHCERDGRRGLRSIDYNLDVQVFAQDLFCISGSAGYEAFMMPSPGGAHWCRSCITTDRF